MNHINSIKGILNSYSEIFFIKNSVIGIVIATATFINPSVGFAGIISLFSAYIFAKFINIGKEFLETGFYTYNALLVGLAVGYIFKITFLTIVFTMISGVLTLIFSIFLYSIFSYYLKLPILSVPFTVISSILYLSVAAYSNLFVNSLYPHINFEILDNILPIFITGYLKSLGTILFLPYSIAGLIFAFLIFLSSRILFFLSIVGYYAGSLMVGFFNGSFYQSFSDISHFNFILIAIALGGIFLIPSIKSYLLAVIGVLLSTIVLSATKTFWASYGIPAFTLPFNFITLTLIYVLGLIGFPMVAKYIRNSPEETLDYFLTYTKRFHATERSIFLPFAGEWTVWQGFDGKWTHKGNWKYAYDFIITDENGESYYGDGLDLNNYYAYKKPVLSPVKGRVVKVVSNLPDNPIGVVDKENNWGNYIIIYDFRGFYVEISHLSQNSIKVKEGDWVEVGTFLGLCGNSGYSPQPHIHVQVQAYEDVSSITLPFSFISYISDNTFFSNSLPKEDEKVRAVYPDNSIKNKLSFYLDNEFLYEVFYDNNKIDEVVFQIKMDLDGSFYFSSEKGKLYFYKDESSFYFYKLEGNDKHLENIFKAIPKIPLINEKNIKFNDFIPLKLDTNKFEESFFLFLSSFNHSLFEIKYLGKIKDNFSYEGQIVSSFRKEKINSLVLLDEILGFKEIKISNYKYKLKNTNFGGN